MTHHILHSTSFRLDMSASMQPHDTEARWWANCILNIGKEGDYDKMIMLLTLAHKSGCLSVIRQTADQMVREQHARSIMVHKTGVRRAIKRVNRIKQVA